MRHLYIACAVLLLALARLALGALRTHLRRRWTPDPNLVLAEYFSPSKHFKVLVHPHTDTVFRIEVFGLRTSGMLTGTWALVSGSSFADRASLAEVVREALRSASGETIGLDSLAKP